MHCKDATKCHRESVINSSSPFSSVSWLLVFILYSLIARNLFSPLQRPRTGSLSSYIISSAVLPFTSSPVFQLGRSCTQLSVVRETAVSGVSHLWVSHTPQHVVVTGTRHIGLGEVWSKLVWLGCNCWNSHSFLKRHMHVYVYSVCVCACVPAHSHFTCATRPSNWCCVVEREMEQKCSGLEEEAVADLGIFIRFSRLERGILQTACLFLGEKNSPMHEGSDYCSIEANGAVPIYTR